MNRHPDRKLRGQVGACLFLGIDETEPSDALGEFLADLEPGGVILFARNVVDAAQVGRLSRFLAGEKGALPRLVGVDQEGGRVERLRAVLGRLPAPARVAAAGEGEVREFAALLGSGLRHLGFHMNFAPVLDLSAPGAENLLGDRALGTDPEVVTRLGRAYLDGLARGGLLGVVKHFPGLGPTAVDTHAALARVEKGEEAFRRTDLRPFQALAGKAAAVLVSHAHYPFWEEGPLPASCSRRIVGGVLRGELSYDGPVIADDLEMGAVEQGSGWLEACTRALEAGCDMLLICRSRERMRAFRDHLVQEAGRDPDLTGRIREAAARVERLRRRAAHLPPGRAEALAELPARFGREA